MNAGMKLEETIEIARPPEEVYAVVADLERAPEWQHSLESVDVQRGVEVRRIAGQRRESHFEVTEREPPRRFAIETRSGPIRANAVFTLSARDAGGTLVHVGVDVHVGGAARLAAPMIRATAGRETRDHLRRLKELLED
jgi:uncharacterized membrane protein